MGRERTSLGGCPASCHPLKKGNKFPIKLFDAFACLLNSRSSYGSLLHTQQCRRQWIQTHAETQGPNAFSLCGYRGEEGLPGGKPRSGPNLVRRSSRSRFRAGGGNDLEKKRGKLHGCRRTQRRERDEPRTMAESQNADGFQEPGLEGNPAPHGRGRETAETGKPK